MSTKSAEEKIVGEGASDVEAREARERRRLMWAGLLLVAVAVFAGGYIVGNAGDPAALVAVDGVTEVAAAQPAAGIGFGPGRGQAQPNAGQVVRGQGRGGVARGGVQGHVPGPGGGAMGMGGGQGQGALGQGPGLGPHGSGTPGGGNIGRAPGQGPYGLNFPGDCPYGVYQPGDGTPNLSDPNAAPGWLGAAVRFDWNGVVVAAVVDGSPAADAGIEVGDVIVEFGGMNFETVGAFARTVRLAGEGSEVDMVLLRGGDEVTVQVTLEGLPD